MTTPERVPKHSKDYSGKHRAPSVASKPGVKQIAKINPEARVAQKATTVASKAVDKKSTYSAAKTRVKEIKRTDEYKAAAGAKRSYMPHLRPAKSTVRYRHILTAEIFIGAILILTDFSNKDLTSGDIPKESKAFATKIEQFVAFLIVFFILSLMTTGGPSMARMSAALGGLVVLTIAVKQTDPIRRIVPPNAKQSIDDIRTKNIGAIFGNIAGSAVDTGGGNA